MESTARRAPAPRRAGALLANIARSVLDEHFTAKWEALGPYWTRQKLRRQGVPAYRLVRDADDFVVMVGGAKADAEALWEEISTVLSAVGLRLSVDKSWVCHINEALDFLGFRIPATPLVKPARQDSDLHLPVEAIADGDHRQGPDAHPPRSSPNTG